MMARKTLKAAGVGCGALLLLVLAAAAYLKYIRYSSSLCGRAGLDLDYIMSGARQYYITDHWDSNGNLLPKGFPQNITKTPARMACGGEPQFIPMASWDTHGWGPVHFPGNYDSPKRTYCTYEFRARGVKETSRYWTRVECPFFCGQAPTVLESTGWIDSKGEVKTHSRWANCSRRDTFRLVRKALHVVTFGWLSDPDVTEWGDKPPPGAR